MTRTCPSDRAETAWNRRIFAVYCSAFAPIFAVRSLIYQRLLQFCSENPDTHIYIKCVCLFSGQDGQKETRSLARVGYIPEKLQKLQKPLWRKGLHCKSYCKNTAKALQKKGGMK